MEYHIKNLYLFGFPDLLIKGFDRAEKNSIWSSRLSSSQCEARGSFLSTATVKHGAGSPGAENSSALRAAALAEHVLQSAPGSGVWGGCFCVAFSGLVMEDTGTGFYRCVFSVTREL